MTPQSHPDPIDLLVQEVASELANQRNPGLEARLKQRSQTMEFASPTNVLQFHSLDRTGGRGMSPQSITVAAILNLAAVLLIALQVHTMRTIRNEKIAAVSFPAPAPEPIKPVIKIPPAPKMPTPMVLPLEPKILLPEARLPEPVVPVPQPVLKPLPMVAPAAPRVVVAASAPRPAAVNLAQSASVVNYDAHPSAVALGHPDNPIHPSASAATANVNLGQRGLPGMPGTNSGGGPASAQVNLGSGQPNGGIGGTGSRAVAGIRLGVTNGSAGGMGNGVGSRAAQISLGVAPPPPVSPVAAPRPGTMAQAPKVLYKPKPAYTAEATALHLEGTVSIRIHVAANGAVSVIGVTKGLGHGLDESAVKAAQALRFQPAQDAAGKAIDWDGVVNILFQMS